MSRQIDITKPLSDEDREYLKSRNRLDELAFVEAQESGEELTPERMAELEQKALEEQMGQRTPLQMDPSFQREDQDEDSDAPEEFTDGDDADDIAYVQQCSYDELKAQLGARGLPKGGTKEELQRRLLDALKQEGDEESGS